MAARGIAAGKHNDTTVADTTVNLGNKGKGVKASCVVRTYPGVSPARDDRVYFRLPAKDAMKPADFPVRFSLNRKDALRLAAAICEHVASLPDGE